MDDLIQTTFPFLSALPSRTRDTVRASSLRKTLEDRQVLVSGGAECAYLPFVLEGALRIYKTSLSGRELTLYRIEKGESCVLSASCILNGGNFPAIAEAQGRTELLLMPSGLLARLIEEDPSCRRFIFQQYARRLDAMLTLVEEVTFQHMDMRLAAYLLKNASENGTVSRTHGEIAAELGTSREVVSRILADFEVDGLISTSRGLVSVLKAAQLRQRSGNDAAA